MPVLKIRIDDEDTEFRVISLNQKIYLTIMNKYTDKDGFVDRAGFLSHIIKEPSMSRKDWEKIPSSMITKILRNVEYYNESVFLKEKELRDLYTQINVYEDELDDLFRYLTDDTDDWAWTRVKKLEVIIDNLKEERDNVRKSLEFLKDDMVVFEEGKEIDYDVQPLQLENNKEK